MKYLPLLLFLPVNSNNSHFSHLMLCLLSRKAHALHKPRLQIIKPKLHGGSGSVSARGAAKHLAIPPATPSGKVHRH